MTNAKLTLKPWVCGLLIENLEVSVPEIELDPGLHLKGDDEAVWNLGCLNEYWGLMIGPEILPVRIEADLHEAEELDSSWILLQEIVDALQLFYPGKIQVWGRYRLPKNWETISQSWSSIGDRHFPEGSLGESVPHVQPFSDKKMVLNAQQCENLPGLWTRWRKVGKAPVAEALAAFKRASAISVEHRVNGLIQTLEALLSEGPGDLKYKVGLRGAFLLARIPDERPWWFRLLKKGYDIRSDIVHAKSQKDLGRDLAQLTRIAEGAFGSLSPCIDTLEERVRTLIPEVCFGTQRISRSSYLEVLDERILSASK